MQGTMEVSGIAESGTRAIRNGGAWLRHSLIAHGLRRRALTDREYGVCCMHWRNAGQVLVLLLLSGVAYGYREPPRAYQLGSEQISLSTLTPSVKYAHHGDGYVLWAGKVEGDYTDIRRFPVLLGRIPSIRTGVPITASVSASVSASEPQVVREALSHPEGYLIKSTESGIQLTAGSRQGLARALVRLAALAANTGGRRLPVGEWADWPDLRIRALHITLVRGVTPSDLVQITNMAAAGEFNTLIVQVTPSGVQLSSFGPLTNGATISQDQFEQFVKYAHESGLQVIPALQLLTHQENLFGDHYPKLMYNAHTYNPADPKVYDLVFPMIDQLVKLTKSTAFMIGHDELAGWSRGHLPEVLSLPNGERPLPASLFLKDVLTLHAHLKQIGRRTWMWADMLLPPVPSLDRVTNLYMHGRLPGYGPALMSKLPRAIVLCDWQYSGTEFPGLRELKAAGFPVLGATFSNAVNIAAFSEYAKKEGSIGMIATTFFYLPRHDEAMLREIVKHSAEAFWNASR